MCAFTVWDEADIVEVIVLGQIRRDELECSHEQLMLNINVLVDKFHKDPIQLTYAEFLVDFNS